MFDDFLTNSETYQECEKYWMSMIEEIETSLDQRGIWKSWLAHEFANGTPMQDGNPLIDGWNKTLDRAFRIVQDRPPGETVEVDSYIQSMEFPDLPKYELVIRLTPSEEAVSIARRLLSKWMTSSTSIAEMKDFIHESGIYS